MERCLNIPETDKFLWMKTIEIFSGTLRIKEKINQGDILGSHLDKEQIQSLIEIKMREIEGLIISKNEIEKGLVRVEKDFILNNPSLSNVYKNLRKELTSKHLEISIEIDQMKRSINEILDLKNWNTWIERIGQEIKKKRNITDHNKKSFLRDILDRIIVDYDPLEKLHVLTIHYKIPVMFRDEDEGREPTRVSYPSIKSSEKTGNQNEPVRDYSTVMEYFPKNHLQGTDFKSYTFRLTVQLKSSNLWKPPYTDYQKSLFSTISQLHEKEGWNFVQISDFLNHQGYKTPRGHTFTHKHVWSIYNKKKRSNERFSRDFESVLTDVRIDIEDGNTSRSGE
jgi:hypothetical protein